MAYPPTIPSGTRINTTPQVNTHPTDHNQIHAALTDIINVLGAAPDGGEASLTALLDIIDPADKIILVGGTTAPNGWGACNGAAVSRTTYAATFARIGTTHGAGDGSTTFNLPNMQDKYPIGAGGSVAAGALVGSNNAVNISHSHTGPSHTHSVTGTAASAGAHTHPGNGNGFVYWDTSYGTNQSATTPPGPNQPWALSWQVNTGSGGAHTHSVSGTAAAAGTGATSTEGSSGTNLNRPASVGLLYCIRLR